MSWTAGERDLIGASAELEVSTRRRDGTARDFTPIWVVCVGAEVYVRSWHRRPTGWFGDAVRTSRASVRVGDLATDVAVEDLGAADAGVRRAVDDAYRAKYGPGGDGTTSQMTTEDAAATTLRLTPVRPPT